MIVLTIFLILLTIALTPVLILIMSIQSNHAVYRGCCAAFILIYSLVLMFAHGSLLVGGIMFVILLLIWNVSLHLLETRGRKDVSGRRRRYIVGMIKVETLKTPIDVVVSLWPLYLLKSIPFNIKAKGKGMKTKVDVKKVVEQLLILGEDTNVDAVVKGAEVHFRLV